MADRTATRVITLFITLQMQTPDPTIWVRRVVHPSAMQSMKKLQASKQLDEIGRDITDFEHPTVPFASGGEAGKRTAP
jgi:hypothetical protein